MAMHTVIDDTLERISKNLPNSQKIDGIIYDNINEELLMKIEIIHTEPINHFDAVKCTIINKKCGLVDSTIIKFSAAFSSKIGPGGKLLYNFIWHAAKNWEWYLKEPSRDEIIKLSDLIKSYKSLFI